MTSPLIHVHACLPLPLPAAGVWQRIGDFAALADWHPGVLSSPLTSGTPAVRRVTLADGTCLLERLIHQDDAARTYSYTLAGGPLPVRDYRATLRVRETGAFDCRIEWSSRFRPEDGATDPAAVAEQMAELLTGAYSAGLCGAAALLTRETVCLPDAVSA